MPSDRRLHPLSLLFSIGAQARSLLLPGLVVLFFASRGGNYEIWFMLLFVPSVISAVFQYWSYRYRLDADELIIREGIVFRNERHIPYARIQNIDLVQNPLHRTFGVAEIRLETAGGQKPEAVMRVLSLDAVSRLRSQVFSERAVASSAAETAEAPVAPTVPVTELHAMSLREVFLFGLISNKGMVVVAAALGVIWQFDPWENWKLSRDSLPLGGELPELNFLGAGLVALIAVISLLILVRMLSVVWALAKFHGFRLTREGDDLRAEFGLFPRVTKTIPRHRIQVLTTREGFLHRRFGRVAVQVETAGSTGEAQGSGTNRLWLAPLMRRERLAALLAEALPEVEMGTVRWESISPRANRRLSRKVVYVALPLTVVALWGLGPWGLLIPAAFVPLGFLAARLYVKYTGYALTAGGVLFRSGWWTRRVRVARLSKIQAVERSESPFDRRNGMASLKVDTAGAMRLGSSIDIPYLDVTVARRISDGLYTEAGATAFRW